MELNEFLELSQRIEKGFDYLKNADESNKNLHTPKFLELTEKYEKLLEKVEDKTLKDILTRLYILSVKEVKYV